MVATTRIDSSVSTLGHSSSAPVRNSNALTGASNVLKRSEADSSKISGLLSKNIAASVALSDSHLELASIDIAQQGIKTIASSLIEIKKTIQASIGQSAPNLISENTAKVRLEQRKISEAMDSQFSGNFVLDSGLQAQINGENKIQFKIEGLDLNRSRWDNELVTLKIDGKISLLMFEAAKTDEELVKQFNKALSFSDMGIEKDDLNELVLTMNDSQWRQSSKITSVIGQGHRFPSGQAIPTNITAINGDISTVMNSPLATDMHILTNISGLIDKAKDSYQNLSSLRKSEVEDSASYLQKFQKEPNPFEPKINDIIKEKRWASIFNLKQNHATISRKTVVDLLK